MAKTKLTVNIKPKRSDGRVLFYVDKQLKHRGELTKDSTLVKELDPATYVLVYSDESGTKLAKIELEVPVDSDALETTIHLVDNAIDEDESADNQAENGGINMAGDLIAIDKLFKTAEEIGVYASVNTDEATEFKNLYVAANYVSAGLPKSIGILNRAMRGDTDVRSRLRDLSELYETTSDEVNYILTKVALEHDNQKDLMMEARAQFDIGTESPSSINVEFKQLFREFVDLCNDDLLGIDISKTGDKLFVTPEMQEKTKKLQERLRTSLIEVMQSMSRAGHVGTKGLTEKWIDICGQSLNILRTVAEKHIADKDDKDKAFEWNVLATLNSVDRSAVVPYVVHAFYGAQLLEGVIQAYAFLAKEDLSGEELNKVLHDKATAIIKDLGGTERTVSEFLRKYAAVVEDEWPKEWAA